MKNLYKIEDELYIVSSSEKIKENNQTFKQGLNGDWFYNTIYNFIARTGDITPYDFKIILTTNKLLIKDGVQAIDDEFLQWFVKNPNCDEISIEWLGTYTYGIVGYKIIIPKEETTAYHYLSCCRSVEECHCGKYPKQELERGITITHVGKQGTLEEAGAIAAGLCEHLEAKEQAMFIAGFQECLKWQKERRYSEKEVEMIARDAYEIGRKNILIGVLNK